MPERSYPHYGVSGPEEGGETAGFGADFDLDLELQRLLGEELSAMEPDDEEASTRGDIAGVEKTPDFRAELVGEYPANVGTSSQPRIVAGELATDTRYDAMALKLSEELSAELDSLYQQITREIGVRKELFEEVTEVLRQAREALLSGPAGLTEAEKLAKQAQGMLRRKEESRRWASSYGALILGYEILFFIAFICILAFDAPLAVWAGTLTNVAGAVSMRSILPFWDTMIWGGIGGVLGALYSLYWHIAEKQDFDRQFNVWYIIQPIMGSMLGALIYLIVASGMLALRSPEPVPSTWLPAALACLCGFRQKFILELLDKLIELIGLRPILGKTNGQGQ